MEAPNIGAGPNAVAPNPEPNAPVNTDPLSFLPDQPVPENASSDPLDGIDLPDKPSALEHKYAAVKDLDPERAAKVMDYSDKLGEPPAFVDKNLDVIHRSINVPRSSFFAEMEENYPGTAEHLSAPKAMAAAHDDMPNLVAHEALIKQATEAHGYLEAARAGFQASALGLKARGGLPDITLPENAPLLESLVRDASTLVGDFPLIAAGGAIGLLAGPFTAAAAGFALPAAIKTYLTESYKKGKLKDSADFIDRTEEILKETTKQGVVGLLTAGAGRLAGGAVSNLASRGIQGAIKATAPLAAEIGAMTIGGAAIEGQNPVEGIVAGDTATFKSIAGAAVLVGGMHAAGALGGNAVDLYAKEQRAKNSAKLLEALGDTSKASKYRQRLPEEYKGFFDKIAEDGPSHVSISAERAQEYFQSKKLDPSVVMEGLGVGEAFAEALSTGGDVKIPISDFVSKLVDTPHFKALLDDVKLNFKNDTGLESVYSVNELAKLKGDAEAKFNEAAKSLPSDESQLPIEPAIDSSARIYQDVERQMLEAGRTPKEAKALADLNQSYFRTLGNDLSKDPYEIYKEQGLTINGASIDGQSLNQESGFKLDKNRIKRAQAEGFDTGTTWYHGTKADIEAFSKETLGASTGAGSAKLAHFFASSPETASDYANASDSKLSLRGKKTEADARARQSEFNKSMKDKYGSKWTSELTDKEKIERSKIKEELNNAVNDQLRETASPAKLDLIDFHIQEKKRSIEFYKSNKFQENKTKTEEYISAKKKQLEDYNWVKAPDGKSYNLINKKTGEKLVNPVFADKEESKYRFYDSQENAQRSLLKAEERLKQYTPKEIVKTVKILEAELKDFEEQKKSFLSAEGGEAVYPVHLKLKNPMVVDFNGEHYRETSYRDLLLEAKKKGHDGVIFKNTYDPAFIGGASDENPIDVAAVFEPQQIRSQFAAFKDFNSEQILAQGGDEPRGKITFADGKTAIELLKGADKSTGVHEVFHFFSKIQANTVEKLSRLESLTEGQKRIVNNHKELLTWLEKQDHGKAFSELFDMAAALEKDGKTAAADKVHKAIDYAMSKGGADFMAEVAKTMGSNIENPEVRHILTTPYNELITRGFEAYVREGKAPTPELQSTFSAFKKWLVEVYKSITQLGVKIDPELTAIYDRMLATDVELNRAQSMVGYSEQELAAYPENVRGKIQDLQAKARQAAEETLLKEQMKELTSEHKNMLAAEKEKFTAAAETDVKALPVFTAIEEIKQVREYSKRPDKFADKFLDGSLPVDEAGHMETLAEQNGFASGEDLAKAIKQADFKSEVSARVDASMAQFADMKDTNVIREKALEAIHTERSTELLALEHEVLNNLLSEAHTKSEITRRKRVEAKIEAEAAKAIAKTILGKKALKDAANPRTYITAERNAALKASKALIAKDYEAASKAKAEQLLNHALVAEANRNKSIIEKGQRALDPYIKRGNDLKGMPLGFMSQVDNLLANFGMADVRVDDGTRITIAKEMQMAGKESAEIVNATGYTINEVNELVLEKLPDFVNRVNEDYTGLELPKAALEASNRLPGDMKLAEFSDLVDSVKKIAHVGKSLNRYISEFNKGDMKIEAAKFASFIKENHTAVYSKEAKLDKRYDGGLKKAVDTVLSLPDSTSPQLVNLLTLCRYLDAGKENGPSIQNIYRPLSGGEVNEIIRGEKSGVETKKILEASFSPKEFQALKERVEFIPEANRKFDREEMIAMLANWGTETGRDRIRTGHGLSDEQVQSIINRLTEKEVSFIKAMHERFDNSWHESAALETEINGVEPKKLDSVPIQTPFGEIPGGYWPLKYEAESSIEAFKNNEKTEALYKQAMVASGKTDQGRFIERAKNVKSMVRLRFDVAFNAIEAVNHDLAYRKSLIDVRRFINQPEVKKAIIDTIDVKGFRGIEKHLSRVAGEASEAANGLDKAIRWFRYKATMSVLGFKLKSFFDIASNAVVAGNEIGYSKLPGVMVDFILNPKTTTDFVTEKSTFMKHRGEFIDRDQRDVLKKHGGEQGIMDSYGFMFQRLVDEVYSTPIWHHIYSENVAELGHDTAKNMADESVKRTFGSGGKLDVTEFQSGSEKQKILTAFGSFNMMMFNRHWLSGKLAGLEFRKENYGASVYLAAKASVLLFGMAGVETLWKDMIRNTRNKNPEDKKKRLAASFIGNVVSPVPVVSSVISSAIEKGIAGKMGGDFQLSPLESSVTTVMKPFSTALGVTAKQFGLHNNAKFDKQFVEDFVKSASIMAGTPQQANILVFNYLDWLGHKNGGELTYKDILTRRTKK